MSVTGIGSTNLTQLSNIQRQYQQVQSEFKQLGQDLQAGNLSGAQTDYVTLSQSVGSQLGSNSPIAKTLETIGQPLQSGNLSAAQQAFSAMSAGRNAVSHHHHQGGATQSAFQQLLNQLGQALQSGNVSAAQQAFSSVQQMWQQDSGSTATTSASAITTTTT
jgi:soluble cytochrome b562